MTAKRLTIESPLGPVTAVERAGAIAAVYFGRAAAQTATPLLTEATIQLEAYFAGHRPDFDLPLASRGTPFQGRMRAAMTAIPYGATRSYGDLAACLDSAPRAVGQACGRNPIPIIVPCHRVLAAGGRLGGFSAGSGTATKQWLLAHESAGLAQPDLFDTPR